MSMCMCALTACWKSINANVGPIIAIKELMIAGLKQVLGAKAITVEFFS
jgi:hypothetical protein